MSSTHPSSGSTWEPPLPEDLQRLLPQYEFLGIIGRGGMGVVYKARQAHLDRDVAVKVLPGTISQDGDGSYAKRFRREARAMAQLSHPSIVSVYDFGTTGEGHLYFVMEFVDGMDIQQYIKHRGGRLPQEEALSITGSLLDAMDYAHTQGVVHRDIKPANVLLTSDGRVKIADFGLAKTLGTQVDVDASAVTVSHAAVGTPGFVAPEALAGGGAVDHRVDLYAAGVMLYQMLTGRLPRGAFTPPSKLFPEIDPRLDRIVRHAMASDPQDRQASASVLRSELTAVSSNPTTRTEAERNKATEGSADEGEIGNTPLSSGKAKRARHWAVGTGIVALVGASAAVWIGITTTEVGIAGGRAGEVRVFGGIEMVWCPPGTFMMGSPKAEPGRGIDEAQHEVTLTKGFWIAKTEATQGQWKTATGTNPTHVQGENLPIVRVSWTDTQGWLRTMNETHPLPKGWQWSLPTEAQWEYACRAGTTGSHAGENLDAMAWYKDNSGKATNPVGMKDPNAWGLHDMHGNVHEWCRDWYGQYPSDVVTDPTGPATGTRRVSRGGSWFPGAPQSRSAFRGHSQPDYRSPDLGFRPAITVSEGSKSNLQFPSSSSTHPLQSTSEPVGSPPEELLAQATQDEPYVNSLGMKFVPVPGTKVLFCIHETRWKDYVAFAAENRGINTTWRTQSVDSSSPAERAGEHPVTNVNWYDADAFCGWLSDREERTYRLPTDAEWSIAAGLDGLERWGSEDTPQTVAKVQNQFPWGTEWPPPVGAGNYSDQSRKLKAPKEDAGYLENYDDGFPTTAPVMSFPPNLFGLHDMGGNANEWVEDWFSNEKQERVTRGSSWMFRAINALSSSYRNRVHPGSRLSDVGFRVVVVLGADD